MIRHPPAVCTALLQAALWPSHGEMGASRPNRTASQSRVGVTVTLAAMRVQCSAVATQERGGEGKGEERRSEKRKAMGDSRWSDAHERGHRHCIAATRSRPLCRGCINSSAPHRRHRHAQFQHSNTFCRRTQIAGRHRCRIWLSAARAAGSSHGQVRKGANAATAAATAASLRCRLWLIRLDCGWVS